MSEQQVRLSKQAMACGNYEIFDLYRRRLVPLVLLWKEREKVKKSFMHKTTIKG
jgi:hypothetical protein